MFDLNNDIIS